MNMIILCSYFVLYFSRNRKLLLTGKIKKNTDNNQERIKDQSRKL